jgi:hypothetical protein
MTSAALSPAQKASRLLELHHASQPLVLINAYDAASAAMIEHCGLPAIATSTEVILVGPDSSRIFQDMRVRNKGSFGFSMSRS